MPAWISLRVFSSMVVCFARGCFVVLCCGLCCGVEVARGKVEYFYFVCLLWEISPRLRGYELVDGNNSFARSHLPET